MQVGDIVRRAALVHGRRPAIVTDDRRVTFAQLADRSARLRNAVTALTRPGDRVAILARNRPEYFEALYGVTGAGRSLVLLNYRLHPLELAAILGASGATLLIAERSLLDGLSGAAGLEQLAATFELGPGAPAGGTDYEDVLAATDPTGTWPRLEASSTACIIYTSGTTGFPKGAMISHRALGMSCLLSALIYEARPGDRFLANFPMCHASAFQLLAFHLQGVEIILPPAFDAEQFLTLVERHRPTKTGLAPTMARFVTGLSRYATADLSSIEQLSYGGMPMDPALAAGLVERFGNLVTGFGQSESTALVTMLSPAEHRRAVAGEEHLLSSCGAALPFTEVTIRDDAGELVPTGQAGELCVRGETLMTGYWHDPAATEVALAGGVLHTGDVATMDADGLVYLVDRKKDMLISGGQNIYPRQIESVIAALPGVADVAVVGQPDPVWGEVVVAFVVARPGAGLGEQDIIDGCTAGLAGYKKPRAVHFVDDLPRNALGKVVKQSLRGRRS